MTITRGGPIKERVPIRRTGNKPQNLGTRTKVGGASRSRNILDRDFPPRKKSLDRKAGTKEKRHTLPAKTKYILYIYIYKQISKY